jgi:DNA-binding NtrC family response regulator
MPKRVLIVEPDVQLRERMIARAEWFGRVRAESEFAAARDRLLTHRYDWFITNLRLKAHNGLHLLHVAAAAGLQVRALVYGEAADGVLGREAQRCGAYYELQRGVHRAIPSYLRDVVPTVDRRNPERHDRRRDQRTGRRCSDLSAGADTTDRLTFPWTRSLQVH